MIDEIRQDKETVLVEKEIPTIQEKAKAIIIKDEPSSKFAADFLSYINKAKKSIEARRKFFVDPLNAHIKSINNEYKALSAPLEEADVIIRGKLSTYMIEAREKERKEAEEKQKKMDEMSKQNSLPEVKIETEEKHQIKSSIGSVNTVKRWDFDLIDFSKVPDDYKTLDEVKVRAMIRAHTQVIHGVSSCSLTIPGIVVKQVESIAVR